MRDPNSSMGKWISMLYRFTNCYIEKELAEYGIGSGQFVLLINLLRKDGFNQEELSNMIKIDKGTTARSLQKLEKQGYIKKVRDVNDRRAYRVYITDKALEIKDKVFTISDEWSDILTQNLTDDEKIIALRLLKQMSHNVICYSNQECRKTNQCSLKMRG